MQLGLRMTETQVTALAAALLGVIRDNKQFVRWLMEPSPKETPDVR